mgnify:FL=1
MTSLRRRSGARRTIHDGIRSKAAGTPHPPFPRPRSPHRHHQIPGKTFRTSHQATDPTNQLKPILLPPVMRPIPVGDENGSDYTALGTGLSGWVVLNHPSDMESPAVMTHRNAPLTPQGRTGS